MPEIVPLLTLSTGHLPLSLRRDIDATAMPGAEFAPDDWRSCVLATSWFGYGWIVHVPEDEGDDLAFPAALRDCLALARRHRAGFLKFDCDAAPCGELPFFDDEPETPAR